MFSLDEIKSALKSLFGSENDSELSHSQKLALYSRAIGFDSYHHLKTTYEGLSEDEKRDQGSEIMRKISALRLPSIGDKPYYEFEIYKPITFQMEMSSYTHWIGWDDKGNEIRAPRPLIGLFRCQERRSIFDEPYYVLETMKALLYWSAFWGGRALITDELVRGHPFLYERFPDCKVPEYT